MDGLRRVMDITKLIIQLVTTLKLIQMVCLSLIMQYCQVVYMRLMACSAELCTLAMVSSREILKQIRLSWAKMLMLVVLFTQLRVSLIVLVQLICQSRIVTLVEMFTLIMVISRVQLVLITVTLREHFVLPQVHLEAS